MKFSGLFVSSRKSNSFSLFHLSFLCHLQINTQINLGIDISLKQQLLEASDILMWIASPLDCIYLKNKIICLHIYFFNIKISLKILTESEVPKFQTI